MTLTERHLLALEGQVDDAIEPEMLGWAAAEIRLLRAAQQRVLALCDQLDADHRAICRTTSPMAAAIRAAIAGPQEGG